MKEIALVTGGSNGIGASIIERAAKDGYSCVNLDIALPAPSAAAEFVRVDLADADAVLATLEKLASGRRVTRLVNNVGIVVQSAMEAIEPRDFERMIAVNLSAAAYATKAVIPGMKEAGFGRIVNISSRSALGRANMALYSATKSGVNGLTRACAVELAPHGITVNAVGPGVIGTELLARTFPEGTMERRRLAESIPANRIGSPEDIAAAVSFFLREENGFVTGQILYVCGGASVSA